MRVVRDYYLMLGVARVETADGVRHAFRELARRYHPDYAGPRGAALFQEIVQAYEVLSDPHARASYDVGLRHGQALAEAAAEPLVVTAPRDGGKGPSEAVALVPETSSVLGELETLAPDAADVLDSFLRTFTGEHVRKDAAPEPLHAVVVLPPEEAARGGLVTLTVPVFHPCPACRGAGVAGDGPCLRCREEGLVEADETVRLRVPPMVADGTIVETSLPGLGLHNLYLRVQIRVAHEPGFAPAHE